MVTSHGDRVISAPEAAELALITYRQLDHWARQEWVTPSVQKASGRGGRRLYSVDDVLRLAALRHFAKSGWDLTKVGPSIAAADVSQAEWLVSGTESGIVDATNDNDLYGLLACEQQLSAFWLEPLRQRMVATTATVQPQRQNNRRSA